jgi:hypothetical protein
MLQQYAALEYGLDQDALHDAVLDDFDPDAPGTAPATPAPAVHYRTDYVSDAVGDLPD